MACRAVVEAPFALLQEQVEGLFGDAVIAAQMTLRLVPELLDAVDGALFVREYVRVVDADMMEAGYIRKLYITELI